MNKNIFKFIVLSPAFFFLPSCGTDAKKKQDIIDEEVKANVESYRQKRLKEYSVTILEKANKIADSLILIKNTVIDTGQLTQKPLKPVKPNIKSALDTTPVVPLLPKWVLSI